MFLIWRKKLAFSFSLLASLGDGGNHCCSPIFLPLLLANEVGMYFCDPLQLEDRLTDFNQWNNQKWQVPARTERMSGMIWSLDQGGQNKRLTWDNVWHRTELNILESWSQSSYTNEMAPWNVETISVSSKWGGHARTALAGIEERGQRLRKLGLLK